MGLDVAVTKKRLEGNFQSALLMDLIKDVKFVATQNIKKNSVLIQNRELSKLIAEVETCFDALKKKNEETEITFQNNKRMTTKLEKTLTMINAAGSRTSRRGIGQKATARES